jgi:hypothetical protein
MNDSQTEQQQQVANAPLIDKLAQFNEYFTIDHDVNVNVIPQLVEQTLPSYKQFIADMPHSFRLASEVSTLEATALRPLRNLSHIGEDLVTFLKAQSRKIDLIMSYILTMEDDDSHRLVTQSFGGGGITTLTSTPLAVGQIAQMKLFFTDEASAIFCYGEVLSVEPVADKFLMKLYYARIREDDREIIVRASLHQQSKQLKQQAEIKRNSQ